jgi:hypothetical protein
MLHLYMSVHPGRVAQHIIKTWYASCVIGESYPIKCMYMRKGYTPQNVRNALTALGLMPCILRTLKPL